MAASFLSPHPEAWGQSCGLREYLVRRENVSQWLPCVAYLLRPSTVKLYLKVKGDVTPRTPGSGSPAALFTIGKAEGCILVLSTNVLNLPHQITYHP